MPFLRTFLLWALSSPTLAQILSEPPHCFSVFDHAYLEFCLPKSIVGFLVLFGVSQKMAHSLFCHSICSGEPRQAKENGVSDRVVLTSWGTIYGGWRMAGQTLIKMEEDEGASRASGYHWGWSGRRVEGKVEAFLTEPEWSVSSSKKYCGEAVHAKVITGLSRKQRATGSPDMRQRSESTDSGKIMSAACEHLLRVLRNFPWVP